VVVLLSGIFAVVLGVVSLNAWRKKWIIDDTPTSTCRGVFVGRNEVTGVARPVYAPITTPFSQTPAVWFSWHLERWQSSGKNSRWQTVERRETAAPFWLEDDTGRVLVRPRQADVQPRQTVQEDLDGSYAPPFSRWQLRQWVLTGEDVAERHRSLADPSFAEPPMASGGFFSMQADTASPISALRGQHRITEQVIGVGEPVYLLGVASPRTDGPGLEFASGDLLVSTRSEAKVATSNQRTALFAGLGCLAMSALFAGTFTETATGDPIWWTVWGIVLAELVALAGLVVVRNHNRQVEVKEQAATAWSMIEVSLQRRHELIPHLVQVVEAIGAHERDVQALVAELRTVPSPPDHVELPDDATLERAELTDRSLRAGARASAAVAEAYPDLQADQVYLDLQRRIVDAEEGVASARQFYNDAIEVLRNRRSQFPGSIFARFVTVPSWRLFEAEEVIDVRAPRAPSPPTP
jgi:LemA protein